MEVFTVMSIEFVYLIAATFLVFSILRFFYVRNELQKKSQGDFDRQIDKLERNIERHNEINKKIKDFTESKEESEKVFNCPNCGAKGQVGTCKYCGTKR